MLPMLAFFIAGFFAPVWPWGLIAAPIIQLAALLMSRWPQLWLWWERSPADVVRIVATSLAGTTVMHGAIMFIANLIKFGITGIPPW
ncbi:hypothetical protein [Novosphingobium capsulatum]|uniref:hypothetical protein n=1 Tax=Novosphingobium capsulatum TaxID=13688 RepID=UPI002E12A9AA|nr:hypothetical protein U0041_03935 [Novosphingobium capsulatum]